MEPESIYVLLFKGIPDAAFYEEKDMVAYLKKHGTSIDRLVELCGIPHSDACQFFEKLQ